MIATTPGRRTADGLESEPAPRTKGGTPRITAGFNLALFLFVNALSVLRFLTTSTAAAGVPIGGLLVSILLDLARYALVMFVTAWFLREFWGRLVASVVPVRAIGRQEAIAVVLMIAALFG
jgi:hypothetical protein